MAEPQYLTIDHLTTRELKRLFSKITIDPAKGCWLWTGRLTDNGYGNLRFRQLHISPHRLMWAWLIGALPMGRTRDIPNLDHIVCDTTNCCFPVHLKLGPQRDNILRSTNNPLAINARKTHCDYGHQLPEATKGRRICRICAAAMRQTDDHKKKKAVFGISYHHEKRYGPNREAFLKRKRDEMRLWRTRKKAASRQP